MENGDHLIWTNKELDYEDWKSDLEEQYPELSEEERIQIMYEINNDYLDDERHNLDIQLAAPIIVIANLGRWNGRFLGYKEIESGNIKDCLNTDTDYATWFVDKKGDLRCEATHHDGTNYYLYRTYRKGVSESQIELLKEKIYDGSVTEKDINRVTKRLGDSIAKVYGWRSPKQQDRSDAR